MARLDLISSLHRATPRNYLQRVTEHDKAACAEVSKRFDREYFDGDRKYGYGGFRYDGRWRPFAEKLIAHYGLKPGQRVLDVGCAKGFLLHELKAALPGLEVAGLDVSAYAIEQAMDDVKPFVRVGDARTLPFPDRSFDLVLSINTLHNLYLPGLHQALRELERVGRGGKFVVMDSYRNEREKVNLLYWQLTCECFFTPDEWAWIFQQAGYTGDYDFVCFE
jgi:protein-L-isoaspartate(D-aspartate) O-methyltransferase